MTTTIQSLTQTGTATRWLKPAPLWGDAADQDRNRPYLAEFTSDSFLRDFLSMMAGEAPLNLNGPQDKNASNVLKLYQPMHQRYYLVLGSLVCRRWGLPDHTVMRKNGESTSFVLRKMIGVQEYGWVNDGSRKGWQPLLDANYKPVAVLPDEQRLPLHSVIQGKAGNEARRIYYGYIPVGSREKYLAPADEADVLANLETDPRLDEIGTRIIYAWNTLYVNTSGEPVDAAHSPDDDLLRQMTLYMILDLGDCLQRFLPDVFNGLVSGNSLPASMPARQALLDELRSAYIANSQSGDIVITLADALYSLRDKLALAHGSDDLPDYQYRLKKEICYRVEKNNPSHHISITEAYLAMSSDGDPNLYTFFANALKETGAPIDIPGEVRGLLKNEPIDGDSYFLRLIYERGCCCEPVVSEPGAAFTFAKLLDPGAPARTIRIELPSIKLKDLRQFKRGIGMQMTPELNDVINRVHTGMLKGDALLGASGNSPIAMICCFSLPIITLLAFIVMFVFLLLFNIIFWWLPFIKICFPLFIRKK